MANQQTTIGGSISIAGIGVHGGAPARITLFPAPAGTGIQFRRTNLPGGHTRALRAHVDLVSQTDLCTIIGDPKQGSVSTIEHLMAAFRGLGVDNVVVSIDGPEMPIMDGSSQAFVEAIDAIGIAMLAAPRSYIRVLKPVRVEQGRAWAELSPYRRGFRLEVEIDFDNALIGRQALALDLTPKVFRRELAYARTFGFMKDFEKLSAMGLAKGSSLDNTVVVGDEQVLNADGLRGADEFVRHKALDAIGDLALSGVSLQGCYRSYCGGHKLNVAMLRALFADCSAWTVVEDAVPARAGLSDLIPALQPAFSPDKN